MSHLPVPAFGGETPKNLEPRCLVVLLLDTSYSMDQDPIQELNKGLHQFADWVKRDPIARKRIEVAIITFDSQVSCIQEPAFVDDFTMPVLTAQGTTKLADGIRTAINFAEARKDWYNKKGLDYYRPFIVLITDGDPDKDQDLTGIARDIKMGGKGKHFAFMPIGIPTGFNHSILEDIAQADFPPVPMNWEDFGKFFKWLSKSMGSVSQSAKEELVPFDAPDWISKTGWAGGRFTQTPI